MAISNPDYSTQPIPYELDWYEKDKTDEKNIVEKEKEDAGP